jgi:hypothetical protein
MTIPMTELSLVDVSKPLLVLGLAVYTDVGELPLRRELHERD